MWTALLNHQAHNYYWRWRKWFPWTHIDEKPIASVLHDHANKIPEALLPSNPIYGPLHDTGFHQSLEWMSTSAANETFYLPKLLAFPS